MLFELNFPNNLEFFFILHFFYPHFQYLYFFSLTQSKCLKCIWCEFATFINDNYIISLNRENSTFSILKIKSFFKYMVGWVSQLQICLPRSLPWQRSIIASGVDFLETKVLLMRPWGQNPYPIPPHCFVRLEVLIVWLEEQGKA